MGGDDDDSVWRSMFDEIIKVPMRLLSKFEIHECACLLCVCGEEDEDKAHPRYSSGFRVYPARTLSLSLY